MTGAQSLIETLVDNGVDVCFANPGTSEMHFVAALDRVPAMRGVLALFEGVANLHNARRAHTPVLVIVGDHATYHKRFDAGCAWRRGRVCTYRRRPSASRGTGRPPRRP